MPGAFRGTVAQVVSRAGHLIFHDSVRDQRKCKLYSTPHRYVNSCQVVVFFKESVAVPGYAAISSHRTASSCLPDFQRRLLIINDPTHVVFIISIPSEKCRSGKEIVKMTSRVLQWSVEDNRGRFGKKETKKNCFFVCHELRSAILGAGAASYRKQVEVAFVWFHSPPFGQDESPALKEKDADHKKKKEREITRKSPHTGVSVVSPRHSSNFVKHSCGGPHVHRGSRRLLAKRVHSRSLCFVAQSILANVTWTGILDYWLP